MKNQLVNAMYELDEEKVISIVKQKIENGESPINIINEIQKGIIKVGKQYDKGKYFIADLIMAGLIFNEALEFIPFEIQKEPSEHEVKVIMATVQQDIHDIGKNIALNYFKSRGIIANDLGVDASPEKIVSSIGGNDRVVLFLSGLITSSYESMKKTIALLDAKGLRQNVTVVICGLVDETVREYVNADYWVSDVIESFKLYEQISREFREQNENQTSEALKNE